MQAGGSSIFAIKFLNMEKKILEKEKSFPLGNLRAPPARVRAVDDGADVAARPLMLVGGVQKTPACLYFPIPFSYWHRT